MRRLRRGDTFGKLSCGHRWRGGYRCGRTGSLRGGADLCFKKEKITASGIFSEKVLIFGICRVILMNSNKNHKSKRGDKMSADSNGHGCSLNLMRCDSLIHKEGAFVSTHFLRCS